MTTGSGPAVMAPAAPRSAPPRSRWSRWWDQVSASLPILLMAVLAGGTYWLVKNTPVPRPPRAEVAPRHEPDYKMDRFSVQHFTPDGRPHTLLEGREARHYPDTDTLEIDGPRVRSTDEHGRLAVATAREALAKGDGSEVELMGEARVVREAGGPPGGKHEEELEFRGEYLKVFPDDQRVESHLPVHLRQGAMQVTADTLKYDHRSRVVELQGDVRGTLPPK